MQRGAVGRDAQAQGGAQRDARTTAQRGVDAREHLSRTRVEFGCGARGVAYERGHGGRTHSLAGDVADHHQPLAVELPEVIEVASHLALLPRRPVQRGDLPTGDLGDRLGQQAVLQRARDRRALAVQARTLDGERRTRGDLLGELEIAAAEAAAGLGVDHRQRTDRALADRQRHDEHGAHAHLAQQAQVLLVHRRSDEQLVGYVGVELRLAGAQHEPEPPVGIEPLGLVFTQARGRAQLGRVGVRDGHRFAPAVLGEQVDGAPVGDLRHGEPGDVAQRLLVVERGGEHVADLREELHPQRGALGLRDVLDDRHGCLDLAVGVAHGGGLQQRPLLVAALSVNGAQQQRLGLLAA